MGCSCSCHTVRGVGHLIACCDSIPIDFWECEYDRYVDDARHRWQRSAHYEGPDDWMCYINDKRTGRPLKGPGSFVE